MTSRGDRVQRQLEFLRFGAATKCITQRKGVTEAGGIGGTKLIHLNWWPI